MIGKTNGPISVEVRLNFACFIGHKQAKGCKNRNYFYILKNY